MDLKHSEILLQTLKALKKIKEFNDINVLDLGDIEIITPFFVAPITAFINSQKKVPKIVLPNRDYVRFYLGKTLKFPRGTCERYDLKNIKKMTYCPLYKIENEMLGDNGEILEILENIIIKPYNLNKNISGCMFFLDELMCNIQEHAKSNSNYIQAQRYGDKLSIAIVDSGITIPNSYKNKGFGGFDKDFEALKNLVFRGISTKEDGRGTGLPNTYRIVCDAFEGSFLLVSKSGGMLKMPNSDLNFFDLNDLELEFQGTIICLMFEIPKDRVDYMKFINKPVLED